MKDPFYIAPLIFEVIVILIILGLSIYSLILFIKLAKRGIKALDIYINEKENNLK